MGGDHSLFLRIDEVEWAWRVVDPVLKVWSMERDFINDYPAGRLVRDAKLYEIGAGTQEIRRMLIGRELFERSA